MDPAFLAMMCTDPTSGLLGLDLDDATRSDLQCLDWSRIRHFTGFITKVHHNDLWPVLPYTRAILKAYRFEIEFFARYRPTYLQLRATASTRNDKISRFLRFLESEISPRDFPGLTDVARHEEARWLAGAAGSSTRGLSDPGAGEGLATRSSRDGLRLVPFVRGVLRIVRFDTDPEASIRAINQGCFGAGAVITRSRWIGYWMDPRKGCVRLLELDAGTSGILAQVDGRRSLATVNRRAGMAVPMTRGVLEVAQTQGLVGMDRPMRSGSRDASRPC